MEKEELEKRRFNMCTCQQGTYTPCRFCFYGACPECYLEYDDDDEESHDPYCRCNNVK